MDYVSPLKQDLAERRVEFVRLLSAGMPPRDAAAAASASYLYLCEERERNADFANAWDDALRITPEKLEQEAMRRAMGGSDKLLMFLLTALKPERYGRAAGTELPASPVQPITLEEREARLEAILAVARARRA